MSRNYGPCMCGATDCPSCGPAQGYEVVRKWNPRLNRYTYVNPEDDGPGDSLSDPDAFANDETPKHSHRMQTAIAGMVRGDDDPDMTDDEVREYGRSFGLSDAEIATLVEIAQGPIGP